MGSQPWDFKWDSEEAAGGGSMFAGSLSVVRTVEVIMTGVVGL